MKNTLLFIILFIIVAIPGCSAKSSQELYNSGEYEKFLLQKRPKKGLNQYLYGRALFEADYFQKAALIFSQISKANSPWRDASLFYLASAFAANEKFSKALNILQKLIQIGKSRIFTKRALYKAVYYAKKKHIWSQLYKICLTGLNRFPKSSYFLTNAFLAARKARYNKLALLIAFRILKKKWYNRTNRKAVAYIKKNIPNIAKLSFQKQITWIEGLIRAGGHKKAQHYLRQLPCKNPKEQLERDLNLVWALRISRNYTKANTILAQISKKWSPNRSSKMRIMKHRHRLLILSRKLYQAFSLLKKIEQLQPQKNRYIAIQQCRAISKNISSYLPIYTWILKKYPYSKYVQKKLQNGIIQLYNKKKYLKLISITRQIIPLIKNKLIRSSINFFSALSAARKNKYSLAAKYAGHVILDAPYSYYHNELHRAIPHIKPTMRPLKKTDTMSTYTKKMIISGQNNHKTIQLLKNRWPKDPLHKALYNSNTSLSHHLFGTDRTLYKLLLQSGYFKECFLLVYKSTHDQGKNLAKLPVNELATAAALCRKAGAYRSSFACMIALFKNVGGDLK